jgi:membrane protein DedA with SNARE-associated domain
MLLGLAIPSSHGFLALSVFAATFLVEDATMVAAALLAASGMLPVPVAFLALYSGIMVSDFGLYGLGAAARRSGLARSLVGEHRIARARLWLRGRLVPTLLGVRLIPGSRIPAYTASGYLRIPFRLFAAVTASITLVWTSTIFVTVLLFGAHVAMLGRWKYAVCAAFACVVLLLPSLWSRIVHQRRQAAELASHA